MHLPTCKSTQTQTQEQRFTYTSMDFFFRSLLILIANPFKKAGPSLPALFLPLINLNFTTKKSGVFTPLHTFVILVTDYSETL